MALATGSALGLVWGLVRGNAAGWGSPEVLGALLAGGLLLAAFVGWELRRPAPMLQVRLFLVPAFRAANVANFCLVASMYGALFFLAQYLQVAVGFGPVGAGLRLMPWTGLLMIGAPAAGALSDRFGTRPLLAGGLVLQAAGLSWLALTAAPGRSYGQLLAPLLCSGVGMAMALPVAQKAAVGAVQAEQIGQASGAFNALRQLGGTVGIAVAVAVFAAAGGYGSPRRFTDGFAAAMLTAALIAFAGAVVAGVRPRATTPRPSPAGRAPRAGTVNPARAGMPAGRTPGRPWS